MNRASKLFISTFFINTLLISIVNAQTVNQDSASNVSIDKLQEFFKASIKQQSRILNGPAFYNYGTNVDGSANFQELTGFSNGDVVYDGIRFNNIPIKYDLYADKVISVYGKSTWFSLVSEKVSSFYLNNHHFKYLDSTTNIIKPGFFDLIFDGESKILVKRIKNMQLSIKDKEVRYHFVPKTTYYLERNHKYEIINGEKSFLNLFSDKKNELKKHLKEQKIKFKKKPEEAMILLATYYESSLH